MVHRDVRRLCMRININLTTHSQTDIKHSFQTSVSKEVKSKKNAAHSPFAQQRECRPAKRSRGGYTKR